TMDVRSRAKRTYRRHRSSREASFGRPLLQQAEQVLAVAGLLHPHRRTPDLVGTDVPHAQRDLLEAGHLQSLTFFHGLDEAPRLRQRLVRAGVEPRHAAAELLDVQGTELQVLPVHVADLELA